MNGRPKMSQATMANGWKLATYETAYHLWFYCLVVVVAAAFVDTVGNPIDSMDCDDETPHGALD